MSQKHKAIFLDRDNTLNAQMPEVTYKVEGLKLLPGVIEGLTLLQDAGYNLYIVTNQSGIARGDFTHEEFNEFMLALFNLLMEHNIFIHDHRVCPHNRDSKCSCRKPEPGMLLDLAKAYDIDLSKSWMVGDQATDVLAGQRAGTSWVGLGGIISGEQCNIHTILDAAKYIMEISKVNESRNH